MLKVTVLTRSSDARNDHSPSCACGVSAAISSTRTASFSSCLKIAKPSTRPSASRWTAVRILRWAPLPLKS
jgi:hypothetical protein